ncbi:thymidylate synthase family protein [Lysobacter gummosus]|nr:thymidylate synthase family protein [Lysobacter gummosus]
MPARSDRNFVLEIASPTMLSDGDVAAINAVDTELRKTDDGIGVYTIAATIFPQRMYLRHGRPNFYAQFLTAMKKGKKPGTWGTYAMRMMERTHPRTGEAINPLEVIVTKLQKTGEGTKYQSAYELGLHEVTDVLDNEVGGELPIYAPASDGGKATNIPCLSHLSFKLDRTRKAVDLTAVYRSHHYGRRALGNLIGLSQLQAFVAIESGHSPGVLTCVSTLAHLDVEAFGGVAATNALLTRLPPTTV